VVVETIVGFTLAILGVVSSTRLQKVKLNSEAATR
jgi:hypothetical protein